MVCYKMIFIEFNNAIDVKVDGIPSWFKLIKRNSLQTLQSLLHLKTTALFTSTSADRVDYQRNPLNGLRHH